MSVLLGTDNEANHEALGQHWTRAALACFWVFPDHFWTFLCRRNPTRGTLEKIKKRFETELHESNAFMIGSFEGNAGMYLADVIRSSDT